MRPIARWAIQLAVWFCLGLSIDAHTARICDFSILGGSDLEPRSHRGGGAPEGPHAAAPSAAGPAWPRT